MHKSLPTYKKQFLLLIKLFLAAKKKWSKPEKKDFLIIDIRYSHLLLRYIDKKNINILPTRGEEINLYVVFYCLFNFNIKELALSYINAYIKITKPKCCITLNHAKASFYKIKKFNKNLTTIAFQNGHTHLKDPNNKFVSFLKKKKINKVLNADHILTHNNFFNKNLFNRYIKGKTHVVGSFRNNYFFKKDFTQSKRKSIAYISQFRLHVLVKNISNKVFYDTERKILPQLHNFCKKNKFNLEILGSEWAPSKEKKFYADIFKNNDWTFRKRTIKNLSYYHTDKVEIVVFVDSNLGFESLARGNKTVSFNFRKNFHSSYNKFGLDFLKERGKFWTTLDTEAEFNRIMNYVKKTSAKQWHEDNILTINQIMGYDPNNLYFQKILSNI